ncbi:monosaccharide ABC transporter ATP-binding protein, CUT2 family [Pleomorphomonas diazotrophica]|nr:monosaccharide ABC transporter ATP-binding protein, CUT2 family [Pleomorphomonas diazotrophica]
MDHRRNMPITLDLLGITKIYPGAVALDAVSLGIKGGEVVGLIGENGAGKSTLMKVLGGAIRPDKGEIVIDGQRFAELSPAQALGHGIAFVHQELNPLTNLDVAGNILLGREIRKGVFGLLDQGAMERHVHPILEMLGARFSPSTAASELSLADLQLLEIAKALSISVRLLILDEPTSSLTLTETQRLMSVIRKLRDDGVAVLFITHRLSEVKTVADRVVGLRDGKNAGELQRDMIDRDAMVRLMIGRDIKQFHEGAAAREGQVVLRVKGLRTAAYPSAEVELAIHAGEILGLAGLIGAGRTELARTIFGLDPPLAGTVEMNGDRVPPGSVAEAIKAGICLVPEDRKSEGLFLDFSISENMVMPNLDAVSRRGFVDRRREYLLADRFRSRLSIKTHRLDRAAGELSGGNQQKVVLAKWLGMAPRLVILDEPTRGIDVGAKAEVYHLMGELAAQGVAVLMISSDMEEVIGVSTRVGVMSRGRITGLLERQDLSEEAILHLAVE